MHRACVRSTVHFQINVRQYFPYLLIHFLKQNVINEFYIFYKKCQGNSSVNKLA